MRITVEDTSPVLLPDASPRFDPERLRVPWPVRMLPIIVLMTALLFQVLAARGVPDDAAPLPSAPAGAAF